MPATKSKSVPTVPHSPPPTTRKMPPTSRLPAMALPTPPRTRTRASKRKRSAYSDSEDDNPHQDSSDIEPEKKSPINHRKKILKLDAIAAELSGQAEEEAFWTGTSSNILTRKMDSSMTRAEKGKSKTVTIAARGRELTRSPTRSPSSSPPAHVLRRNRTGLISPPPSRRAPRTSATVLEPKTPPRKTPARKAKAVKDAVSKKLFPERDSPNNPFLVGDDSPGTAPGSSKSPDPRTPEPYVEKPTITWVHRGVKAVLANPLYHPSHKGRVPSPAPDSPSRLPENHLEFSPSEYCPPKLLFPEARQHDHARVRKRRVEPAESSSPTVVGGARSSSTAVDGDPEKTFRTPVKGKGKRIQRPVHNDHSEWDSSDDEDYPRTRSRMRRDREDPIHGVQPKVPALPGIREVPEQDESQAVSKDQVMGARPKKPISSSRVSRIAPLLLAGDAPRRS